MPAVAVWTLNLPNKHASSIHTPRLFVVVFAVSREKYRTTTCCSTSAGVFHHPKQSRRSAQWMNHDTQAGFGSFFSFFLLLVRWQVHEGLRKWVAENVSASVADKVSSINPPGPQCTVGQPFHLNILQFVQQLTPCCGSRCKS